MTALGTDCDPFGKVISGTPPRLAFIDKETDLESGLADFSARKFNHGSGAFPSVDPLWEHYRSTSPYVYCFDDPIRWNDPSGKGGGTCIMRALEIEPDMGGGAEPGAYVITDRRRLKILRLPVVLSSDMT